MMDRRKFIGGLGASAAVLSGAPSYAKKELSRDAILRISLNGLWERHVAGRRLDTVPVPSSRRPSGHYTLSREFVLPTLEKTKRAFVHFEAITYWARVSVNGLTLGVMDPYVPYDIEFTRSAKEGSNLIQVEVVDLAPLEDGSGIDQLVLGLNPGWEAHGGIIRDVYVEVRPQAFVENVRTAYQLGNQYRNCHVAPQVIVSSASSAHAEIESILWKGSSEVARTKKDATLRPGVNKVELTYDLNDPALWSPREPNLYRLTATLRAQSSVDTWSCNLGFRDFQTHGRDFLLNGERVVLNGVCRHDMWKSQGFTLAPSQQEDDMRMIKMMGCNFVRLVHYPHDRRIIELADELGLMVSEEPGYWNMDFATMPRSEIELGYRILERTIRRDWNSPSVVIWFLSNECGLTESSLAEGKRRCNRLDPIHRLVSAANSRSPEVAKPLFIASGMDFFDQHPYTIEMQEFASLASFYGPSKPLTLSEWGGLIQMPVLMTATVDSLIPLIKDSRLAGTMFWSWQDVREYSRIGNMMQGGVLESGVVTESRRWRRVVSDQLTRLFELQPYASGRSEPEPEILPLRKKPWSRGSKFETVDLQPLLQKEEAAKAWADLRGRLAAYWHTAAEGQWEADGEDLTFWRENKLLSVGVPFTSPLVTRGGNKLLVDGVPFTFPVLRGRVRPLVVTPSSPELVIPLKNSYTRLHILGQVTLPDGFPVKGKLGDTVANYTVEYMNSPAEQIPLRTGYEVARANCIYSATRIDPVALNAQPVLRYIKDPALEHYQILLYSFPLKLKRAVQLSCKLVDGGSPLAIFAITGEQAKE